jgi:hypothetical protein
MYIDKINQCTFTHIKACRLIIYICICIQELSYLGGLDSGGKLGVR